MARTLQVGVRVELGRVPWVPMLGHEGQLPKLLPPGLVLWTARLDSENGATSGLVEQSPVSPPSINS
jgi:hypothetical protein